MGKTSLLKKLTIVSALITLMSFPVYAALSGVTIVSMTPPNPNPGDSVTIQVTYSIGSFEDARLTLAVSNTPTLQSCNTAGQTFKVTEEGVNRGGTGPGDPDIDGGWTNPTEVDGFNTVNWVINIPSTLSAEALYLSRDKFRCFQILSEIPNIRLPKTILINNTYKLPEILESYKFPIVIKIPNSTRGTGTILATNVKNALDIIETLFIRSTESIMIQEFLKNTNKGKIIPPADIRVLYVGDEILGSMKRIATNGEWKTNYAQGAICEPYKLNAEDEELVYQVVGRLGIEVAGVDLFPTEEGTFILEVNACPGWKAFEMANPHINVAQEIVEYLMTKIRY